MQTVVFLHLSLSSIFGCLTGGFHGSTTHHDINTNSMKYSVAHTAKHSFIPLSLSLSL